MSASRPIGDSGLFVSPVAMGCWPIAGVTSLHVNDADSIATLQAALDQGLTHFDTAHCYGYDGESESLIARAIGHRRNEFSIATKTGIAYDNQRNRITDGRPATLRRHCEISLRRLNVDRVELLYLHAPDPHVPLAESAAMLDELRREGKAMAIGLSNASLDEIQSFHSICRLSAVQLKYNLLQREIESAIIPWCQHNSLAVVVFWPLMKGILAGRMARDHVFEPADPRLRYPIFHGRLWQANQDVLDALGVVANNCGKTIAQVVVNWTMHRPGITSVLCGAKRPWQIIETAAADGWRLDPSDEQQIAAAYARWLEETSSLL